MRRPLPELTDNQKALIMTVMTGSCAVLGFWIQNRLDERWGGLQEAPTAPTLNTCAFPQTVHVRHRGNVKSRWRSTSYVMTRSRRSTMKLGQTLVGEPIKPIHQVEPCAAAAATRGRVDRALAREELHAFGPAFWGQCTAVSLHGCGHGCCGMCS